MFEFFMYPVSGIMKFWHWLISGFVDESAAWLVSHFPFGAHREGHRHPPQLDVAALRTHRRSHAAGE